MICFFFFLYLEESLAWVVAIDFEGLVVVCNGQDGCGEVPGLEAVITGFVRRVGSKAGRDGPRTDKPSWLLDFCYTPT